VHNKDLGLPLSETPPGEGYVHIEIITVALGESVFLISVNEFDGAFDHMGESLALSALERSQLEIGDYNEGLQVFSLLLREKRPITVLPAALIESGKKLVFRICALPVDDYMKLFFAGVRRINEEIGDVDAKSFCNAAQRGYGGSALRVLDA
jgi:hypothetical protein